MTEQSGPGADWVNVARDDHGSVWATHSGLGKNWVLINPAILDRIAHKIGYNSAESIIREYGSLELM